MVSEEAEASARRVGQHGHRRKPFGGVDHRVEGVVAHATRLRTASATAAYRRWYNSNPPVNPTTVTMAASQGPTTRYATTIAAMTRTHPAKYARTPGPNSGGALRNRG